MVVEPSTIVWSRWCEACDDSDAAPYTKTQMVTLSMKADERLTFKMKSTRPPRFKIRPAFGFIEKGHASNVRIECRAFDQASGRCCTCCTQRRSLVARSHHRRDGCRARRRACACLSHLEAQLSARAKED